MLASTRYLGFKGPTQEKGELMKTRRLVWLVSLAVFGGLISLGGPHLSKAVAQPQLRTDGTDPVPPPPTFPKPTTLGASA